MNVVISDSTAHEREIRLFNAINHSSDSIIISDIDARIIEVNEATLRMHGVEDREEIIGKDFFRFIATDEQEEALESISNAVMEKGYVKSEEHTIVTRAGIQVPVDMSIALVKDKGNKLLGLVCILRDITERARTRAELERSNRELDNYTYAISHDLKEPLRSIGLLSEFILEDYKELLDETGKNYVNQMIDASNRMTKLINDLLLLSRVGRIHTDTDEVGLNMLLNEIMIDLEAMIKDRGAKILVGKLPTIEIPVVWMKQLFTNLISNGMKFNESPTPLVEVECEERQNDYLFSVNDNGIGIEEQYQKQIFALFKRLHTQDEYPGTGAGLSICKKIVESIGGSIWVESRPGNGSTFFFTYPKKKIRDMERYILPEIHQDIPQVQV